MIDSWRASMAWLHTWAGLLFGLLLFVIFWMGTLSVFDREIDQWMMPEIRFEAPVGASLDKGLLPVIDTLQQEVGLQQWGVTLADERTPYARLFYQDRLGVFSSTRVDLERGRALADPRTLGATGFIFPFHYSLHLRWQQLGIWLVGLAAMAMLALLVSGVIIHRKLFRELFTLRLLKQFRRATLDLHNLSGVAFLPFLFFITLSGLIIFINIYFASAGELVYTEAANPASAFFAEASANYQREAAGAPLLHRASLDAMLKYARDQWQDEVGFIRVFQVNDANSVVQFGRSIDGAVSWNVDKLFFDAGTGEILHESAIKPLMNVQRFFVGLHFIQFNHWPLRWLYFLGGLAGCVLLATGLVFWAKAREKRHRVNGSAGSRRVMQLTLGGCLGLVIATIGWMLASVALPQQLSWGNWHKPAIEVGIFLLIWALSLIHAFSARRQALSRQCLVLAVLCVLAILAQGWETGAWLWRNVLQGQWAVAGTDVMLGLTALVAAWVAQRLSPVAETRFWSGSYSNNGGY